MTKRANCFASWATSKSGRAQRACPVFVAESAKHFARSEPRVSAAKLVSPIEVAGLATPQAVFEVCVRRRHCGVFHSRGLLAGPRVRRDDRLGPVDRLLEPRLLLGLEERMVLEGILGLVDRQGHLAIKSR